MKKIIISLAVIIGVAAIAGVATYAYFSDTATVTGNTFATGTLNIEQSSCVHHDGWWEGQGGGRHWHNDWDECNGATKIEIKNAQPGSCETGKIKVKNVGTLTARDLTLAEGNNDGSALCAALEISPIGSIEGTINVGQTKEISAQVCFPNKDEDQSALQGKTCTFELVVGAKAYEGANPAN